MKSFVVIILAVCATSSYGALKTRPNWSHRLFSARAETCKEGETVKCSTDCSSIVHCETGEAIVINCMDQTGKPYCNKNTHQCEESSDNCDTEGGEKCSLKDGFYPELSNCRTFYFCENKEKIRYTCEGTSVFNPSTGHCEFGIPCYIFTANGQCKGQSKKLVPHPLAKNLYVYCGDTPVLLQCPSADNVVYEFDVKSGSCAFVCKSAGRFPDIEDATRTWYYECIKSGTTFVRSHKQCQKGTVFENGKCHKSKGGNE